MRNQRNRSTVLLWAICAFALVDVMGCAPKPEDPAPPVATQPAASANTAAASSTTSAGVAPISAAPQQAPLYTGEQIHNMSQDDRNRAGVREMSREIQEDKK